MVEVYHYITENGENVFETWLSSLKDDTVAARIAARIARLAGGNYGDCKPVGKSVWELRIDIGPGYRVYYAKIERTCVLLLAGGDKSTQAVDINRAITNLNDYRKRTRKP